MAIDDGYRRPAGRPFLPSRRTFLAGGAAACVLALLPSPVLAALSVVYVDSASGDDAASGTDPISPVRTLARARVVAGGAGMLRLRRGGLWREQLEAWPGLDVSSYGEGARPSVRGSDVVVGPWTTDASGIASAPLAADPGLVWIDGIHLPAAASPSSLETEAGWAHRDGRLRVRMPTGIDPRTAMVEAAARTWGIFSYGTADDVSVEDVEILHATKGVESHDNHGWKVRRCRVAECRENAVRIVSGGKSIRGVEVVGNEIGAVRWNPVIDYWRSGIAVCGADAPLVADNRVAAVNVCGIWMDEQQVGGRGGAPNAAPVVRNNVVEDCMGGIYVFQGVRSRVVGNVVRKGRGLGIGFGGARSVEPYAGGNLVHDLEIAPDRSLYNGFDINNCPGGILEFNTVARVSNFSVTLEDDEVPSDDWIVRNNIFDARRNTAHPSNPSGPAGSLSIHDGVTRWRTSHNCYAAAPGRKSTLFERGDTASPYLGFLAMLDLTGEEGAVETDDPMFVDADAGDFHLAAGSPCRGSGENGADMGAYGTAREPGGATGIDIHFRIVR